jgi:hypothetical protein
MAMGNRHEEIDALRASELLLHKDTSETEAASLLSELPLAAYGLLMRLLTQSGQEQQDWQKTIATIDPAAGVLATKLLYLADQLATDEPQEPGRDEGGFFRFKDSITGLNAESLLPLSGTTSTPIIRLIFLGGEGYERVLLSSDHDLEDTLRLAGAIVSSVDDVLHSAEPRGLTLKVEHFADGFADALKEAESAIGSVRDFWTRISSGSSGSEPENA